MSKIIDQINAEQMTRELPEFAPGDQIVVHVKVKEGDRERLQAFEGIVIAKRNRGLDSAFTVRKISYGEGVERVFQTYSPMIGKVEVKRRGDVNKAKLYYLRERSGKAARIREKLDLKGRQSAAEAVVEAPVEAPAEAVEETKAEQASE